MRKDVEFMADVFRLSKNGRKSLELFKKFYLDSWKENAAESEVCADIYREKLNYSDAQWLEFAITVACTKYLPRED